MIVPFICSSIKLHIYCLFIYFHFNSQLHTYMVSVKKRYEWQRMSSQYKKYIYITGFEYILLMYFWQYILQLNVSLVLRRYSLSFITFLHLSTETLFIHHIPKQSYKLFTHRTDFFFIIISYIHYCLETIFKATDEGRDTKSNVFSLYLHNLFVWVHK